MPPADTAARLTSEMQLCIACCRSVADEAEIERLVVGVDWQRLIQLARFHRIEGLVWRSLSKFCGEVRADVRDALAADAKAIAVTNVRAIAESRMLLQNFSAAGVKLLFLKGLALGALAYRNPSVKSAIDIDILVDPAELLQAAELLRSCGYSIVVPAGLGSDESLDRWHRFSKESVWYKDAPPIQLDLHTAVSDTPWLIPSLNVHAPSQVVEVATEIRLPTFADEQLFAYLAVHGAWSCWYRLKWIADIAGLLDGRSGEQLEGVYRRSLELGAGRAAQQTLLLAEFLFGTLRDAPALREALRSDPTAKRRVRQALGFLLSEKGEPNSRRFGTVPIHWMHFQLLDGVGAKVSELARKLRWLAFRISG